MRCAQAAVTRPVEIIDGQERWASRRAPERRRPPRLVDDSARRQRCSVAGGWRTALAVSVRRGRDGAGAAFRREEFLGSNRTSGRRHLARVDRLTIAFRPAIQGCLGVRLNPKRVRGLCRDGVDQASLDGSTAAVAPVRPRTRLAYVPTLTVSHPRSTRSTSPGGRYRRSASTLLDARVDPGRYALVEERLWRGFLAL